MIFLKLSLPFDILIESSSLLLLLLLLLLYVMVESVSLNSPSSRSEEFELSNFCFSLEVFLVDKAARRKASISGGKAFEELLSTNRVFFSRLISQRFLKNKELYFY